MRNVTIYQSGFHAPTILRLAIFAAAVTFLQAAPAFAEEPKQFDLPAQDAATALQKAAIQGDFEILIPPKIVAGKRTNEVHGSYVPSAALAKLLRGTGLTARALNSRGFVVEESAAKSNSSPDAPAAGEQRSEIGLPQQAQSQNQATGAVGNQNQVAERPDREVAGILEPVVVTGTNIRGSGNSASPVLVYSRDDIDRSGAGSVSEFIQKLPQNFNGGASDSTIASITGGGSADNAVNGTGVNLRGLGNDSTLVLINGRRVAPGNLSGNFVDISLIPLAAVDRVEIVLDGASAIYGSDAVGGVINFILRKDFEGAETRMRYGFGPEGRPHESQVGQTFGHAWEGGSALLSLEYDSRSPLNANDRAYTQGGFEPFTLLPQQERLGIFATANQFVSRDVELFADGTYSRRSSFTDLATPNFVIHSPVDVENFSATLGGRARLSDRLNFELSASYGASSNRSPEFFDGTLAADSKTDSSVMSLDAKLDGTLWKLPTGSVLFAAGAQYRRETLDQEQYVQPASSFTPSRDVEAGFLELKIPLMGPGNAAHSGNQLELSLADRYEHYSDFGSTNNPKAGLVWRPADGVKLRGTYGTSFVAPLLNNLNPVPFQVVALQEPDPLTNGTTNALVVFGGNPNLKPQTADTWTIGVDWTPNEVPGLRASATYYDIRFKDRITDIQSAGFDVSNALQIANILGPAIVQRNPPASLVQSLAATPGYSDFCTPNCPLSTIGAIVDSRSLNLSAVTTSGIDFGLSYKKDTTLGSFESGVDGTYILKFNDQIVPGSAPIKVLNTPYNPIDLKVRAREIYQRGAWTAAAFINYVNRYSDNRSGVSVPVNSWTTADVTLAYKFGADDKVLRGASVSFSIQNIANTPPPYVVTNYPGAYGFINYDGANANILGRFISLQFSKLW